MNEIVVRIAARGDGVTQSGRYVAFGVPGDVLMEDGALAPGTHHQDPLCRHFPECGGCQLQHADDEAYRAYLTSRVRDALDQHGLETEIRDAHLSPPRTRRRASLRALRTGKGVAIGFNAAKSNQIVDMQECHILRRELFALVAPLRSLLGPLLQPRRTADLQLTLVDQGVDLVLKGIAVSRLDEEQRLIDFSLRHGLARLSIDRGLGPEILYEPEPATIRLSGTSVRFPPGAFLQATADGESALVSAVQNAIVGSRRVADLFAGLGTFALAARATYAAEGSRDAAQALAVAAPGIRVEHRDLYRRPLDSADLKHFDAVILDPPRAGAQMQIGELAASGVARIAHVSCNAATFARDARTLCDSGYALDWLRPVGQFRWSTHVELAACFTKRG